jgi:hypothetical protein
MIFFPGFEGKLSEDGKHWYPFNPLKMREMSEALQSEDGKTNVDGPKDGSQVKKISSMASHIHNVQHQCPQKK